MSSNQKPIASYEKSLIRLAIWDNTDKDGKPYRSATITVRYTDGEGNWKTGHSFYPGDLADIAALCLKAFTEHSIHSSHS